MIHISGFILDGHDSKIKQETKSNALIMEKTHDHHHLFRRGVQIYLLTFHTNTYLQLVTGVKMTIMVQQLILRFQKIAPTLLNLSSNSRIQNKSPILMYSNLQIMRDILCGCIITWIQKNFIAMQNLWN